MILICIKIFLARILDVTLGTIRTVVVVKGKVLMPFIIAFFEVIIWFIVAKEALLNTTGNTMIIAISYAAGYATGTLIGSYLSKRLIKGIVGVDVILSKDSDKVVTNLRDKGYEVSILELKKEHDKKPKDMLFLQVSSVSIKEVTAIIKKYDDSAFIVVNDTKYVQNGFIK